MAWFFDLFKPETVALTVLVLSLITAVGLALGSIRFRGINLGIGGVLFAGLFFGWAVPALYRGAHPGAAPVELLNKHVLEFAREFGLILFVYTIGVQVGPGFLASLRRHGLPLNLAAASIVLLGAAITLGIHYLFGVDIKAAIGLFSGGTTNTPSLGAAQQAIQQATGGKADGSVAVAGYAIAYPFGILGIILVMLLVRTFFKISLAREAEQIALHHGPTQSVTSVNIEVRNPNLEGLPIYRLPHWEQTHVVISRVMQNGALHVAKPATVLHVGDVLLAVGPREELESLRITVGSEAKIDLKAVPSAITTRPILVTKKPALGKTAEELNLLDRFGVTITRIRRGEVEFTSTDLPLQFGDSVLAVGEANALTQVAHELRDSPKVLNHPEVIPIFVGLLLGVVLGSIPIKFPMIPAPVKLGLAGGPLVVAIILSRLGHFGPLVWYLPPSANFALREIGIVLFLAGVGYMGADKFVATLVHGPGLQWVAMGALITFLPLAIVGFFARAVLKWNYMSLCGVLAGSMTDPPALAFAGTMTGSDAPGVAYATVYPLTMLLRVIVAQAIVLAILP